MVVCMHVANGGDFADTQRDRAAVLRRSIHVLGILCFRLRALLRCLVTTKRETEREGNFGKMAFFCPCFYILLLWQLWLLPCRASKANVRVSREREGGGEGGERDSVTAPHSCIFVRDKAQLRGKGAFRSPLVNNFPQRTCVSPTRVFQPPQTLAICCRVLFHGSDGTASARSCVFSNFAEAT